MTFQLPLIQKHRFDPLNYCMYCNATEDLCTEHIVPFGLDGNLELPKASCIECGRITGAFEQIVLRGAMRPVRLLRELQSRRKHRDAPKLYSLRVRRHGVTEDIQLPLEEYPILLPFPLFSVPGYFTPDLYSSGVSVEGIHTVRFGADPEALIKRLGAEAIELSTNQHPAQFARMIAKIAYAMAVATGAVKHLSSTSPVIAAILGRTNDIGRWVGTITDPLQRHDDQLHRVAVIADRAQGLLIGDVQLFCDSDSPRYGVVLGKIAKNAT